MKMDKIKYLIIGNSAGGIGAAEAIREVDKTGSVAIISDEPYPAYSRPLISEHLSHGLPVEKMLFRPAAFYEANNIQTMLGRRVEQLDTRGRSVKLDDGTTITWQKLLLATGGQPIVPPIKGIGGRGVFNFITLDDAKEIDRFLGEEAGRVVVIGGGLIGTSATEALLGRGLKVTVVEMKDRVLNTILDEPASALETEAMTLAGVDIITNHTVAEINSSPGKSGSVTGVTLDDGRKIGCNLVVVAIGVTPRTELASASGIKVNRGIVVDRHMATSLPDVYACGDVAEAYDFVYGEARLTPIWPNAYLGGRVAGFNMAGDTAEYPGGTAMNAMSYFGVDVVSAGIVTPPDDSFKEISQKQDGCYRKVVVKGGCCVGMVFCGDIEKSGIVFALMRDRVDVSGFSERLVADDFGLVCLPEERWRPLTEAPLTKEEPGEKA
jgi:NAD(P)H-nitrite reductase large subunit